MVSQRQHYNQLTGDMGENQVFEILRGLGYSPKWGMIADIEIEGMPIEVKTSNITAYRADGRRGYQFCLRRDGHCKIQDGILVLVCTGNEETAYFVIPTDKVENRRKIAIPNTDPRRYRGMWSDYLDAWQHLEEMTWTKAQSNG